MILIEARYCCRRWSARDPLRRSAAVALARSGLLTPGLRTLWGGAGVLEETRLPGLREAHGFGPRWARSARALTAAQYAPSADIWATWYARSVSPAPLPRLHPGCHQGETIQGGRSTGRWEPSLHGLARHANVTPHTRIRPKSTDYSVSLTGSRAGALRCQRLRMPVFSARSAGA